VEGGERIAINPDQVVSLAETAAGRVTIYLRDGGPVTVKMSLETIIARLSSVRDLSPERK
jgi:hypothetical protein